MSVDEFLSQWNDGNERLLVYTSGSTGKPKPLWVEKHRMEASARMTCRFLGLKPGDTALLCLPLDYIAGKMMVVRALTCGLRLVSVEPDGHPLSSSSFLFSPSSKIDFTAMVPLQVYNTIQVAEEREWLQQINNLIIGGGAINDDLARELRSFPNAVWSTYGMTETLSHIALRRLSGSEASEWYTPFDGVSLSLNDEGCLVVSAPQVCADVLTTNDLAVLRSDGSFRILGRRDNVVCSGGMKIQIEEVERLLHKHTQTPLLISKRSDSRLGEALVLLTPTSDIDSLRALCQRVLPTYWQPRYYLTIERLPMTETGKPARKEAEKMCTLAKESNTKKLPS